MKKYLPFLFCGFASSLIWGCYNLLFLVVSVLAYGDDVTSQLKKSFILITVIAILLVMPFFFIGRCFDYERVEVDPLLAAVLFAIPQLLPLVLVYICLPNSMVENTITWWTRLMHFAYEGKTHYEDSFAINAALTYIPIFVSYLGMITKKKKETTE